MSTLLQQYQSIKPGDTVIVKGNLLREITNATPLSIDNAQRVALVIAMLEDLAVVPKGRISNDVILPALVALKTLGRDVGASQTIGQKQNLDILYGFIKSSTSDISKEAMRCVANALLLVESARTTWLQMGGGEICLNLLKKETSPDYIFLASRILFVITVQQSDFITKAVDSLGAIECIATKLDSLLGPMQSSRPMSKEALIDVLKFVFNLLLQYPRMTQTDNPEEANASKPGPQAKPSMGELWDEKLAPLVPALLHLFNSLPQTTSSPLAPPLTHVIHALLNIPITPYAELWFPSSGTSTPVSRADPFQKARQMFSGSSPSSSRATTPNGQTNTLRRAYNLLDAMLAHYITGEPDDPSVRELCRKEDVSLDDTGPPLALLIGRMIRDNQGARIQMKGWLIPADLDRSSALEKRSNLLGRCLRMMTSVYFPKLKDSIGEMLFALCNSDPNLMAAQLGYGNCAGFLFNKGIMAPPASSDNEAEMPTDPDINPITGAKQGPSPSEVLAGMSDEEKEREAEKLFVLFDRMEKLGLAVNPVRKAQQEGRLEEIP